MINIWNRNLKLGLIYVHTLKFLKLINLISNIYTWSNSRPFILKLSYSTKIKQDYNDSDNKNKKQDKTTDDGVKKMKSNLKFFFCTLLIILILWVTPSPSTSVTLPSLLHYKYDKIFVIMTFFFPVHLSSLFHLLFIII